MPKIPYKAEAGQEEDEDYEIVSFEDFCDKSPSAKADLLTLNDNINYRLHYESDKKSKIGDDGGSSSRNMGTLTETSLDGPKNATYKRKLSFAPFGRIDKTNRGPIFSGVIPKPRSEGESTREHRYERFSPRRGWLSRVWEQTVNLFPGILAIFILCALCVAAWWTVGGALAGSWGDDHYRKLWERAHPEDVNNLILSEKSVSTEYRYHDHNNLSTKNRSNVTDVTRKKDLYKKNTYTERPLELLKEMCGLVSDDMRFDCYPQNGASEEACVKRGCCWKSTSVVGAPYCFYPPQYDTYHFVNSTENKHGLRVYYGRDRDPAYPRPFNTARLDFYFHTDYVLQIKISDADNKRFEPPYPEIPVISSPISAMKYRVHVDSSAIGFKVIRNSDNVTIMNTQNIGGLILSDKFLQISALLPTDHIYGLGEKQARFMNDMNWKTYTLFNNDMPPTENLNLYGTHPFYLALEKNGNSHGVLLLNSNAMDVVLQPTPAITFRTIGGILNFYVLLGPSPAEVVAQYTELVGRPFMPPYWSLGFHLCKYNYGSLNVTRDVWQKNRDAGIPFDVQWNDLDYMSTAKDFTYDKNKFAGLPDFVKEIHDEGMHYMILFDPGVSAAEKPGEYPPYDRGLEMNVFVKNSTDQPFVGKDMNEPSNFISGSLYGDCEPEDLPYKPHALFEEGLRHKTLCMDAKHYAGRHYDIHNLYALAEAIKTHSALLEIRGKRPFIISRASFPGLGRVAGHWSGDIASSWHDMRMTIPDLLSFSLFGVPMMGADICGFTGDTTEELCKRWMQLGAFYPFSRNHNSDTSKPQDPVSLGAGVVRAARAALRARYRLLPYLYWLFWRAHRAGDTVARPLFFQFPSDEQVHDIDTQFMLGPHVMITPILEESKNTTKAYFPGSDMWYSLTDGQALASDMWREVTDSDMVSIKGGSVLPLQAPPAGRVCAARARSAPLQLLVAPAATAAGALYWDDGDSLNSYEEKKYSHIKFAVQNNQLTSTVKWWGYGVPSVDTIIILGQTQPIATVTINGVPAKFSYVNKTQVLTIPNLNLALDKEFKVRWTYKKNI